MMNLKELTLAAPSKFSVPASSASHDIEFVEAGGADQGALRAARSLRHLLRMIPAEPAQMRTPQHAVRRLRPFVDHARFELQAALESGGTAKDFARGLAHLTDGAVAGLCHIARFCADDSSDNIIPPYAAVGVDLRARHRSESLALELFFVVPDDAAERQRADRMVAFVLIGLSDLGFSISYASSTPSRAASLAEMLTGLALTSRDVRFVWGRFGLYDDLVRRLPVPMSEPANLAL